MPGNNGTPPLMPTPALTDYEMLYSDAVDSLAALLSDDELENRSVGAGATANEFATQIEPTFERQLFMLQGMTRLEEASKKLHSTGRAWMPATAQHSKEMQEAAKQKYEKLRTNRGVQELEDRTFKRFEDLRRTVTKTSKCHTINNVIGSTDAVAVHYGQSNIVAEVNLQDSFTVIDEVRSSAEIGPDQSYQNFRDFFTERVEVRRSTDAAPGQLGQSIVGADMNFQDTVTVSDEVRRSTDAAADQYGQSNVGAGINFDDLFTVKDEVGASTHAASDQYDQLNASGDIDLQDPFTENNVVRRTASVNKCRMSVRQEPKSNNIHHPNIARPPAVCYYEMFYADLIIPLAVMLTDDYKEQWTWHVDADDVAPVDLIIIKGGLPLLNEELQQYQKSNSKLASFGREWMDKASMHPKSIYDEEQKRFNKLRSDRDVPTLHRRAKERIKELQRAISHMRLLYNNCQKIVERSDGFLLSYLQILFPDPRGVFETTTSAKAIRRLAAKARSALLASDMSDDKATTSHFVDDGDLERLFSETPASSTEMQTELFARSTNSELTSLAVSEKTATFFGEDKGTTGTGQSGYFSTLSHRCPHSTSILKLSALLRKAQSDLDVGFFGVHSSQRKLAQAMRSLKETHEVVSSERSYQPNDAATMNTTEHADVDVNGQYSDKNKNYSYPKDEFQISATETEHMPWSLEDYQSSYAASVRRLYAMLVELEDDLRGSLNIKYPEISELEMEQVIQVLKQASNRVSATATRWMRDAAVSNCYQAEWQALQATRKKLNVICLQRRASAMLQELRKSCRKEDHTRHDSLHYFLREGWFGKPVDKLVFGNKQASLSGNSPNSHRKLRSDAVTGTFLASNPGLRPGPAIETWRTVPPDKMASKTRMAGSSSALDTASAFTGEDPRLEASDVNNNVTNVMATFAVYEKADRTTLMNHVGHIPAPSYPAEYMASTQQLSTMLGKPEDGFDKTIEPFGLNILENSQYSVEQIAQVLKQASNRVSKSATKWMADAARSRQCQLNPYKLQTAHNELSIASLQPHVSDMLVPLRHLCSKTDQQRYEQVIYDPSDEPRSFQRCSNSFLQHVSETADEYYGGSRCIIFATVCNGASRLSFEDKTSARKCYSANPASDITKDMSSDELFASVDVPPDKRSPTDGVILGGQYRLFGRGLKNQMRTVLLTLIPVHNAKRNHQVFEAQMILAKQLCRPNGGHYTRSQHLRDKETMNIHVQSDAIKLMSKARIPDDYPIHFRFWSENRAKYDTWVSNSPKTLSGYNSSFFMRSLTEGQLELRQTIRLDSVTFESDSPHHGTECTSQALGTSAGLVFAIKKFKELCKRRADERAIAQKSMENVIHRYRPDLSIVVLPVPTLSGTASVASQMSSASARIETSASGTGETRITSPLGRRPVQDSISDDTQTMFELAIICYAGSAGLHATYAIGHWTSP